MIKSQKGFAILETILILAIVGIMGGTGYFVWHSRAQTSNTLDAAASEAGKTVGQTSKSTEQEQRAVVFVKNVYTTYFNFKPDASNNYESPVLYIKSDLTPDFYSAAAAQTHYDPLLCAENMPTNFDVKPSSSNKTSAVVHVITDWDSNAPITFPVTVDLVSLKISGVKCL